MICGGLLRQGIFFGRHLRQCSTTATAKQPRQSSHSGAVTAEQQKAKKPQQGHEQRASKAEQRASKAKQGASNKQATSKQGASKEQARPSRARSKQRASTS